MTSRAAAAAAILAAAAAWLLFGRAATQPAAVLLASALAASFAVHLLAPRRGAVAFQAGIHAAALLVADAIVWRWAVSPLLADPLGFLSLLAGIDTAGALLALSPLAALAPAWMLLDAARSARLDRRDRRRLSRSDLHGKARLLAPSHLRALSRRRGILIGQRGRGGRAPLVAWNLEGAALTIAPPRTGKGAQIALNYLSPGDRGWNGSTVLVDPRGETYCIVARRRRLMGREVVLLDPFGIVAGHAEAFGDDLHLPATASASYNPLDWIRGAEGDAVRDIDVLLDALLTPPTDDRGNSRHFYESARAIIGGYMAWVRFGDIDDQPRTLATLHGILSAPPAVRQRIGARIRSGPRICGGLPALAAQREEQVGKEEGGSNFTTIANQLAFLVHPQLAAHVARSTFDPAALAAGNVDLFVVAPEDMLDTARAWLRLWITIPNAVAARRPLERDMLVVLDEMPRLGYLKPVMDAWNMAAGKGIHFWCHAQSLAALDDTWGQDKRRNLVELAEVFQILGFPRSGTEAAENLAKAIGTATFESRSESSSGSAQGAQLVPRGSTSESEQISHVRELLVTPDQLMTMAPDEQYVIAAGKDVPRDALHLNHARYWLRPDARLLADPNPFVTRKAAASAAARIPAPPPPRTVISHRLGQRR